MEGDNLTWMTYFRQLISEKHLNYTFWCYNANSGDTGGLVKDDFKTWDDEKYAFVKDVLWQTGDGRFIGLDHEVPLGKNGIALSDYTGVTITPAPVTPAAETTTAAETAESAVQTTEITTAVSETEVHRDPAESEAAFEAVRKVAMGFIIVAIIAVVLIIAVVAAGIALKQKRKAEEEIMTVDPEEPHAGLNGGNDGTEGPADGVGGDN